MNDVADRAARANTRRYSDEIAGLARWSKALAFGGFAIQGVGVVQTLHDKGPAAAVKELGIDVASDIAGAAVGIGGEVLTGPPTFTTSTLVCIAAAAGTG